MGLVIRREDFSSTADYIDAVYDADRRECEMHQKKNPKLGRRRACTPEADQPKRLMERNDSSEQTGSRPSTTVDGTIAASSDSDAKDVNLNDGDPCPFSLAAPPSLLHLVRPSPSLSPAPSDDGSLFSSGSSLTPPPPSARPTSARASMPAPDPPKCGNCLSTTTSGGCRPSALEPAWRLCNACYRYEHQYQRNRPKALSQRRRIRRFKPSDASPWCSNCHSATTSSGGWRSSKFEPEKRLCNACSVYERMYHRRRPLALARAASETPKIARRRTKLRRD